MTAQPDLELIAEMLAYFDGHFDHKYRAEAVLEQARLCREADNATGEAVTVSRSRMRRVAAEKGEDAPRFDSPAVKSGLPQTDFLPCCDNALPDGIEIHRAPAPWQLRGDLYLALCKWCGRAAPFIFYGAHRDDVMPQAIAEWNRHLATPEQPAIDIDACVDRFLGWRLPDDFAPDDGISFTPITNPAWLHDNWPIGTNLLTAVQARAMLEYVLNWTAGAPSAQQPLDGPANNAGVATGSRNGPPSESVTRGNPPSNLEQPGSAVQGGECCSHAGTYTCTCNTFTTPPPAPDHIVDANEKAAPAAEQGDKRIREAWDGGRILQRALDHAQPESRGVEGMDLKEKGRLIRKINYTLWMHGNGDGCEPTPDWQEGYNVGLATPNPVRAEQPEGKWKLVPVEATSAMLESALTLQGEDAALARSPALLSALLKIYRAMLASAPAAPGAGVGVDAELREALRKIGRQTEKMDPASCEDCYTAACIANGALARTETLDTSLLGPAPVGVDEAIAEIDNLIDACGKLGSFDPFWPVSRRSLIRWRAALAGKATQEVPHG